MAARGAGFSAMPIASSTAGQSISLFKRAFHEVPDLVLSCSLGVAGIFATAYVVGKHYYLYDEDHTHKHKYTVIRAEDVKKPEQIGNILN